MNKKENKEPIKLSDVEQYKSGVVEPKPTEVPVDKELLAQIKKI